MIVDRVEAIAIRVPFRPGGLSSAAAWGGGDQPATDSLLVRVETRDGLIGWGETFGFGVVTAAKAAIETMIAPLIVGADAAAIGPLMAELQRKLHIFGRSGPVMYGLSALDIALWDLAGKEAGLPVHRLMGGARADRVEAYASLERFTDPDLVARQVCKALDAGFRHVKLHEIDPAAIRAAREAAGPDVSIMLDVNCAWSLEDARMHAAALDDVKLRWIEEPIWPPEDFAGLAALRRTCDTSIAAGENASTIVEFERMMAMGAVDVIQPSPAKMGGLTELVKVATLAAVHRATLMIHSFYDGPGLLAALQATAALGLPGGMVEWRFFDLEARPYGSAVRPVDGYLGLPEGPGLGFDTDKEFLRQYAAQ